MRSTGCSRATSAGATATGLSAHGADHVVPLLAPPSLTVPVVEGRLHLGTWQSICLLDPNADNPVRTVHLSFLPG